MTSLRIEYDRATDVLTVEGISYSGGLFRTFAEMGINTGQWIKAYRTEDGIITLRTIKAVEGQSVPPS